MLVSSIETLTIHYLTGVVFQSGYFYLNSVLVYLQEDIASRRVIVMLTVMRAAIASAEPASGGMVWFVTVSISLQV